MVCRHAPGDPNCSSNKPYYSDPAPTTPDASSYQVTQFQRVGNHVVLRVKYPNCYRCAYEGNKVMVFLNVTEAQILCWRRIDPHFRNTKPLDSEAPSPAARFPASPEGWKDALEYARTKSGP